MELATALKIAGLACGLLGTILLALRVTRILDMLVLTAKSHDLYFKSMAARAQGRDVPVIAMYGHDLHLDKVQQGSGTRLLIAGFALQIVGMGLNAAALLV